MILEELISNEGGIEQVQERLSKLVSSIVDNDKVIYEVYEDDCHDNSTAFLARFENEEDMYLLTSIYNDEELTINSKEVKDIIGLQMYIANNNIDDIESGEADGYEYNEKQYNYIRKMKDWLLTM